MGTAGGTGILYASFSLADISDLANPIGMACDWRTVMHELFGHGILFNHIGAPRFNFSHSAGDSFAAILSDPGSQAPDRFDTFPWWQPGIPAALRRRHDRAVAAGFGWSGDIALHPFDNGKDRNGYNNEQILSTTMFRFYLSIGGGSTEPLPRNTSRRASPVYLMLAAIPSLTPATVPGCCWLRRRADGSRSRGLDLRGTLGRRLQQGDPLGVREAGAFPTCRYRRPRTTTRVRRRRSMSTSKTAATANTNSSPIIGAARQYGTGATMTGAPSHEEPVVGVTNFAYVKIKNRGSQVATNVIVQAFHCQPSGASSIPMTGSR